MKKPNATLEWKGRKLMCNGVCVASLYEGLGSNGYCDWRFGIGNVYRSGIRKTEAAARRAVNRRFKITEDMT